MAGSPLKVVPCYECTARILVGRYRRLRRSTMDDDGRLADLVRIQLIEEDRQANAFGVVDFGSVYAVTSVSSSSSSAAAAAAANKAVLQDVFDLHTQWLADIGLAVSTTAAGWPADESSKLRSCCTTIYERLRRGRK